MYGIAGVFNLALVNVADKLSMAHGQVNRRLLIGSLIHFEWWHRRLLV